MQALQILPGVKRAFKMLQIIKTSNITRAIRQENLTVNLESFFSSFLLMQKYGKIDRSIGAIYIRNNIYYCVICKVF